ncbi:hypothetical protein ACVIF9_002512 [Bradyrhizobium sp. USDA 4350]
MRGRQQIAQVVIDLGDGEPERGKPALLMQHRDEVALHVRQLALGNADLVAALAGHDDSRRTLRILVEADQARGQPPHRADEQIMQRQIDQAGGQAGDQERDHQNVAREAVHRLPQRFLVDHDLDELRLARRGPDHADGLVTVLEHDLEGIDDRRPYRHGPHVDIMVDRGRQVSAGEQAALLAELDGDGAGADAGQDLPRQRIRHQAGRGGIEHQRRGVGGGQAVIEPVHPEVGDGRHVDQEPGDHHQRNRQQQKLARQPEPKGRLGPLLLRGRLIVS